MKAVVIDYCENRKRLSVGPLIIQVVVTQHVRSTEVHIKIAVSP
uniref:Uncharacterized protein n=1 Tax=Arundo donax TaxID=35708 RepID=A0A0A9BMG4_ARUDO